jgi:hypothetical protein
MVRQNHCGVPGMFKANKTLPLFLQNQELGTLLFNNRKGPCSFWFRSKKDLLQGRPLVMIWYVQLASIPEVIVPHAIQHILCGQPVKIVFSSPHLLISTEIRFLAFHCSTFSTACCLHRWALCIIFFPSLTQSSYRCMQVAHSPINTFIRDSSSGFILFQFMRVTIFYFIIRASTPQITFSMGI